jgi:hypothetical protein
LGSGAIGKPITYKVGGKQHVSVWSGVDGWVGIPVTAGLDLSDNFGTIGETAMRKAANLDEIPLGSTLYAFRVAQCLVYLTTARPRSSSYQESTAICQLRVISVRRANVKAAEKVAKTSHKNREICVQVIDKIAGDRSRTCNPRITK